MIHVSLPAVCSLRKSLSSVSGRARFPMPEIFTCDDKDIDLSAPLFETTELS